MCHKNRDPACLARKHNQYVYVCLPSHTVVYVTVLVSSHLTHTVFLAKNSKSFYTVKCQAIMTLCFFILTH